MPGTDHPNGGSYETQSEYFGNGGDSCPKKREPSNTESTNQEAREGWVCPKCGHGVAPWMPVCPCNG